MEHIAQPAPVSEARFPEPASSSCRALPLRAGLGLKPEHFNHVHQRLPDVGFFEVHAENHLVAGGPLHHHLSRIREHYPLSIHGVGLSIGAEDPIDTNHLNAIAELLERYQPAMFSEHLAWSSHGGVFFNDLLPLPYNLPTLRRVCDHIDLIQTRLGRRILLENPATYVEFSSATWSEGSFMTEVIQRTGCGLLLDVNNVYVTSINHGHDPLESLRELPWRATEEIHLAGFAEDQDSAGARLLIDHHGAAVADAVWSLYAEALRLTGARPTLLERDNNLPTFEVLQQEAGRAEEHMAFSRPPSPVEEKRLKPHRARRGACPMSGQNVFSQALLDPRQPTPSGIVTWNGSDPGRRMAVYRNNVMVSLVDALAQTFPVTQTLVGDTFFRAMGQVFVREHPPRVRVLNGYGTDFPAFIEHFAPAASVPYLADVARLEMLRMQALHAADAQAMSPSELAHTLQDPDRLPQARWRLCPSLRIFHSQHAACSLWAAHQDDCERRLDQIDTQQPETALVFRHGLGVIVWQPPPGGDVLVEQLAQGLPLQAACEHACDAEPDFDFPLALAGLMRHQLLVGVTLDKGDGHTPLCQACPGPWTDRRQSRLGR